MNAGLMQQLQAQMGQMPGGGGGEAPVGGGPLDHLRVDPQFNMLRQLVQVCAQPDVPRSLRGPDQVSDP